MRAFEIEAWASRIIEQVEASQPIEDSRVELKSGWQDPKRLAREIAAHANAARGDPILWLIGIHQRTGIVGVQYQEFSNWFQAIKAEFNEMAPEVHEINIPVGDKTIVALLFETDRFPYVVKNPAFGIKGDSVSHEVPWRDGQNTRTANRSDLIKLLAPLEMLPDIDILSGELRAEAVEPPDRDNNVIDWYLRLVLYVVPRNPNTIVIPFYKCQASFEIPNCIDRTMFGRVSLEPPRIHHLGIGGHSELRSLTIDGTNNEVLIGGPGVILLDARLRMPSIPKVFEGDARISADLLPTHSEKAISISTTLPRTTNGKLLARWQVEYHHMLL